MAERLILCSACGIKNRLGDKEGTPRCGKCGKPLEVKGRGDFPLSILFVVIRRFWLFGLIGFIIFVWPYLDNEKPKSSTSTYQPVAVEKPAFNHPPVPTSHGIVSRNYVSGVAPLEIQTRAGSNYFVKVVNVANNQSILTAYIQGGRPFEVQVPVGTYEIRYAAGNTWYGPDLLFGPETSYSKADELFQFIFDGYQYSGYRIELILQAHGNLRTRHIDAVDF